MFTFIFTNNNLLYFFFKFQFFFTIVILLTVLLCHFIDRFTESFYRPFYFVILLTVLLCHFINCKMSCIMFINNISCEHHTMLNFSIEYSFSAPVRMSLQPMAQRVNYRHCASKVKKSVFKSSPIKSIEETISIRGKFNNL